MSLKLTDTQRRQIQRGNFPHLALEPDEAKALEPHRITITRQLWIEVTGAKRDKKAGWYAVYTVRDDRPRFMRRGQGYTHSLALAVANEDTEAVPEEFQRHLTQRSHDQWSALHHRKNMKQELNRLTREIRNKTLEAERRGFDASLHIKRLEEQLASLQRELGEDAA